MAEFSSEEEMKRNLNQDNLKSQSHKLQSQGNQLQSTQV